MIGEDFPSVVAAAQAGEEWAIATLYRDMHPAVLAFAATRVGGEAEDLTADVFVTLAERLVGSEGDERSLRRWVFTIAYRKVGESRRMARRRKTRPAPYHELEAWLPTGDAEAEALDGLSTADALAAIARLGSPQAEVVLLRVVADLSVEDVAAIVGKRPGAVRALQHRALVRLAREFSHPGVTRRTAQAMTWLMSRPSDLDPDTAERMLSGAVAPGGVRRRSHVAPIGATPPPSGRPGRRRADARRHGRSGRLRSPSR